MPQLISEFFKQLKSCSAKIFFISMFRVWFGLVLFSRNQLSDITAFSLNPSVLLSPYLLSHETVSLS